MKYFNLDKKTLIDTLYYVYKLWFVCCDIFPYFIHFKNINKLFGWMNGWMEREKLGKARTINKIIILILMQRDVEDLWHS